MKEANPTMGGAPVLVDGPTRSCTPEEPVWLTDGLAMPWVDASKSKVEEPLGMYLDPDHEPFPAKRTRPLVEEQRR